MALTYSPDSTWTPGRLMIGSPLAWRLASGLALELSELVLDDGQHLARIAEQVLELRDQADHRLVLVFDLLALECRQPAELHLQDGVGLGFGELEPAPQRGAGRVDVRR